jgi:tRNA(Arg) A34 adenosine deaminase TadA
MRLAGEAMTADAPTAADLRFMRRALERARGLPGHPFAAVIADPSRHLVLAEGANRHEESAIWHGEVDAIARLDAIHPRGGRSGLTLYTTAEPCPMCQAAILWAGIPRVVYGTSIPFLAAHGWWQIDLRATEVAARAPGRPCTIVGGVLEAECDALFAAGP